MTSCVIVTPLKRIENPKGDIYHAIKATDVGFAGFGEAYFTSIACGETKGWKQHTVMHMNLIVPVGDVEFHVREGNFGETSRYIVGKSNYVRLTIPAGYWVAFSGKGQSLNLVLNVASLAHDPEEAINLPLDAFPLVKG